MPATIPLHRPQPIRRRRPAASLVATLLAGASASVLAAAAAQAQDAATTATGTIRLAPITVADTAEVGDGPVTGYVATRSRAGTKTDTPLGRTPQSVTVVPSAQIEDQGAQSVSQALRYSTGVFTEYRGSSNFSDEMYIRGYGYVPRYVDGLTYGWSSLGKIDPFLLERVEVVRGPSSILYGEANPGGLVNLVTKRATGRTGGQVQVSAGTDETLQAGFDVEGLASADGSLAYRLVGTGHTGDGVEDFVTEKGGALLPSLTWTPTADTSVTVSGMYSRAPEGGFRNFREAAGTLYPTAYGHIPIDFFVSDPDVEHYSLTQASAGYEVEHRIDDVFSVRQVARYAHIDSEHTTLTWGALRPDGRTITRSASGGGETFRQVGIDTQVQADFATGALAHVALLGLDYKVSWRDYQWGRGAAPAIDWLAPTYGVGPITLTPSSDSDTTADQIGVYLQDQIEIGDLTLSVGGRHDWAGTEIEDRLAGTTESFDDSAFSGRVGALYALPFGISPYVSYSTSFEPVTQAAPAGRSRFEPTTAEQIEAGVKIGPDSGEYQLVASVFDITQNNVIKTDPVSRQPTQTGEIHTTGFELEGRAQLTSGLSLVATYTALDQEVTESAQPSEVGKMPSRIPKQQASLWGTYEIESGPFAGLGLGAGVRYVGESWGDAANTFEVDAATLYDAMIRYKLGYVAPALEGAEVRLNATNLTDERYTASCASAYACWYGAPRTVIATVSYAW